MSKPLAIDIACGLGGWTEGLLLEGFDVIGFDIERHRYGSQQYPAQLVLQDILTLDGRQFRGYASLIVASPPCQRYSYMAMPWTRAKDLITWHRDPCHPERILELNALFEACLRIGREAGCPIVIENVRGAIPWVGRSRWNYGSFHLWGDVPALMPIILGRPAMKEGVAHRTNGETNFNGHEGVKVGANNISDVGFNVMAVRRMKEADDSVKCGGAAGDDWFAHHNRPEFEDRATKNSGGSWFNVAHNTASGTGQNPDGRKIGADWFNDRTAGSHAMLSSKSSARKAASARIAKIPLTLARHIARTYYPR